MASKESQKQKKQPKRKLVKKGKKVKKKKKEEEGGGIHDFVMDTIRLNLASVPNRNIGVGKSKLQTELYDYPAPNYTMGTTTKR